MRRSPYSPRRRSPIGCRFRKRCAPFARARPPSRERRPVQLGKRNGEYVEVLTGLKAGEYVVTKGAYQVKMASMSSQVPAHGHEH